MLGEASAAQFALTGVLGPHSNAHGPNEFPAPSDREESDSGDRPGAGGSSRQGVRRPLLTPLPSLRDGPSSPASGRGAVFFPRPLAGEGGSGRSSETGEGARSACLRRQPSDLPPHRPATPPRRARPSCPFWPQPHGLHQHGNGALDMVAAVQRERAAFVAAGAAAAVIGGFPSIGRVIGVRQLVILGLGDTAQRHAQPGPAP